MSDCSCHTCKEIERIAREVEEAARLAAEYAKKRKR